MGKVKNWAMDNAENFLSNLESQIRSGAQTVQSALLLCECADIAWDLIGFDHMSEVEEYLEDVKRKAFVIIKIGDNVTVNKDFNETRSGTVKSQHIQTLMMVSLA